MHRSGNSRRCAICKKDAKLYRPYGEFLRLDRIRCIRHLPDGSSLWTSSGWWVPLIEDTDGSVWGYTSAHQRAIDKWFSMPDKPIGTPQLGAALALFITLLVFLARVL